MQELGYDGRELFRKGRFRPATFWKTEHVDLVAPAVHKDRTLLTAFQINPRRGGGSNSNSNSDNNGRRDDDDEGDADNGDRRYWYVLNCHLQAGPQGPRRVRQMHEGVRSVLTLARKLKGKHTYLSLWMGFLIRESSRLRMPHAPVEWNIAFFSFFFFRLHAFVCLNHRTQPRRVDTVARVWRYERRGGMRCRAVSGRRSCR